MFKNGVEVEVIKEHATICELGFEVLVFKVIFSSVVDPPARIRSIPPIGKVSSC